MKAINPLTLAVGTLLLSQAAIANETPSNLGALQVTVDRQGAKVKTNIVTTTTKDESTATDLRGLLKGEPSIDFSGGHGAAQFLTIRGMGQNSIDVKVDNAYSDSQMFYHQGRFSLDPSLVRVVAVQKGAGSASAGIGQTNGAIVAKTVDAQSLLRNSDKDWGLKVNAGFSSNNEHSVGVTGFAKVDAFDFLIATNHIDQKDYKAGKGYVGLYNDSRVGFSSSDKESHLFKVGYDLNDNHRFVLSHFKDANKGVRNIREEFDVYSPEYLSTLPQSSPIRRLSAAGQAPEYRELYTQNTNLEWTGQNLGFIDEATANVYVMKNSRVSSGDNNNYSRNAARGNQRLTDPNTASVITKGANVNFDSHVLDNTLVKYGLNYRHQEAEPNQTGPDFVKNTEKTDVGVYAEAIHDIGQFTLTGGLRYDHFDYTAVTGKTASGGALSPSVGVIYQATPNLSFNANHNHATRSPRLADAFLSGIRNNNIADGIKAERAKNSEVGFNYNDGALSLDGGVFYQTIDDLNSARTVHDATGAVVPGQTIDNVGRAKNQGWELNAGYRLQNLTARLGVAESKPKFYTYEGRVSGTSPIEFTNREYGAKMGRIWTAGLSYRFANPSLEVGLNHRLAEKVTGIAWQSGGENNSVRDGYNTTDVYANWKPLNNEKVNVNFAINNIADELYRPHNSQGLPATGREYRVGVNFTY